jgi:hydroxymethylpyrimidine pyrophosphatase-like HAD family hydrolase
LQTCITSRQYLEFTAPGADKAHGVAAVAARYALKATDVMAFGDGNNDIGMLGWAGLGVAMRDGRPAAHEAADRVSPPGDPETALARSIAMLLYGREDHALLAEVA